MPILLVLATTDSELAGAWEGQLPQEGQVLRLGQQELPTAGIPGLAAVVILDSAAEALLPAALARSPTIYVGEPHSLPFEQAKMAGRARVYLSYEESATRLGEFLPLMEELAEKQSMLGMLLEKTRHSEQQRPAARAPAPAEAAEIWDFLEGAVENLENRDRLITEFRRASRHLLHASHAVFFFREVDGFRADRGTSFFTLDDPLVAFFEGHPAVIDGNAWESRTDPIAELSVRNRLALWGARLLVPIHDNGRLLGLVALGVRDDGQPYDEMDRARAVFFARLLRHCLAKAAQLGRLNALTDQSVLGAKYLPSTLVLGPAENPPRQAPVVVRDLIGQARRSREVCRVAPAEGQPFRAAAGLVAETGGVWAFWEEASGEVRDAAVRQRADRRGLLREIALTLSHEVGNSLVSLATLRQFGDGMPIPPALLDDGPGRRRAAGDAQPPIRADADAARGGAGRVRRAGGGEGGRGRRSGCASRSDPDPVVLALARDLVEFALRSLIETIAENRPARGMSELQLQVRSSGEGPELTALLSVKGRDLELEGILPEPIDAAVPNQGRLGVFLAKEILRLHHGEIHAGPGLEGTEILISLRSL